MTSEQRHPFLEGRRGAAEKVGYLDITSPDKTRRSPLVLRDGTSIEWPVSWDDAARDSWRKANGLERP
jgi:hypothetical protein